jgi:hypothetical protein
MKKKISKQRNPYVSRIIFRKCGAHFVCLKAERKKQKEKLQKETFLLKE